jgi:hypothetical protein
MDMAAWEGYAEGIFCGDFLPRNSLKNVQIQRKIKKSTRVDFLINVLKCTFCEYIFGAVFTCNVGVNEGE